MTSDKAFKRKIRRHARDSGLAYTAARRHLLETEDDMTIQSELLSCSFCGKTQQQVDKLIAGPSVYICNECVAMSVVVWVTEREPRLGHWDDELLAARIASTTPEIVAAGHRLLWMTADSVRRQLADGKSWGDVALRLRMTEDEARRAFGETPDGDGATPA
jgi:hypothetical protein